MNTFNPTLFVAMLCSTLLGTISVSRADITFCNHTAETLFVTYVLPSDECESGQQYDTSLLSPNACTTPYQESAMNETFYFEAWSQTTDLRWGGGTGIWIPGAPNGDADGSDNNWCLPVLACKPSSGNACGGGVVHSMRQKSSTDTNKNVNLVY